MSKIEHTPTPLVFVNVGEKENYYIVGTMFDADTDAPILQEQAQQAHDDETGIPRDFICETRDRNYAAFIVRACNAHEELVQALQELISILEIHMPPTDPKWQSNYLDKARAALAQATQSENRG